MTSEASDYREVAEDMLAAGLTCMQVSQILPVKRRTVIDWGHLKTHGRKENFLERMGLEREAFKTHSRCILLVPAGATGVFPSSLT